MQLANSIGDGVIATNCTGSVLFMNPRAEELTGWRLEEAVNKPSSQVLALLSAESRTTIPSPLCEAFVERELVRNDRPCLLAACDGSSLEVDYTAGPISNEEGEVTGAVIVFRTARSASGRVSAQPFALGRGRAGVLARVAGG